MNSVHNFVARQDNRRGENGSTSTCVCAAHLGLDVKVNLVWVLVCLFAESHVNYLLYRMWMAREQLLLLRIGQNCSKRPI